MKKHFRIGILGGMGPEAGILLQSLILRETPAEKDQDHIEAVTYTNPHVPDRTRSLREDGGASYLAAVRDSLRLLEAAEVDILVMACNTAHARLPEIRAGLRTPLLDMVDLARREIGAASGPAGLLATDGTLASGLFALPGQPGKILAPEAEFQRVVMEVIHAVKAGRKDAATVDRLAGVCDHLRRAGCQRLVLGCTELSILHDDLEARLGGGIFIAPLRLAARALVQMARSRPPAA